MQLNIINNHGMFKVVNKLLLALILVLQMGIFAPLHAASGPQADCRGLEAIVQCLTGDPLHQYQRVIRETEEWWKIINPHGQQAPEELTRLLAGGTEEAAAKYVRSEIASQYDFYYFIHQFKRILKVWGQILFPSNKPARVPKSILSLGVGTGIDIEALAAFIPIKKVKVVGVDFSEPMIEKAKEKKREKGWSDVHLVQADLRQAPDFTRLLGTLEKQMFDVIVSFTCVGQYFSHEQTVEIIRDWIAPHLNEGGALGFAIPSIDEHFSGKVFSAETLGQHPWVLELAKYGIELQTYVPVQGATQIKYFLVFERKSLGGNG